MEEEAPAIANWLCLPPFRQRSTGTPFRFRPHLTSLTGPTLLLLLANHQEKEDPPSSIIHRVLGILSYLHFNFEEHSTYFKSYLRLFCRLSVRRLGDPRALLFARLQLSKLRNVIIGMTNRRFLGRSGDHVDFHLTIYNSSIIELEVSRSHYADVKTLRILEATADEFLQAYRL
ncbi:uncharacterized protein LOC111258817 isoform X2 [Varroa jacobsoni]|uniref:uncharacterized protein LOC111258817 isoform X2 n=1 Tax=Varroa jacobsoni TaxID=62625 RepID=UPI000BF348A7|nr:uncharacterized protein LOC111258817 isoform X2 [Varroa jacobsoni]XP_022686107.1 uncharacterized protein LOC111258817 isoform X2 [Varroa jacobsoni]